ncbi:MAG: EAL domain-containing protein [Desulfovibrionaceae bacterium]|jgi:diguanylate cyclase (GGDEF)-like protein|nr:EAL domain-containing protein [Desulfovibrionaceae bacterium]
MNTFPQDMPAQGNAILVVDDEPINQRILATTLEAEGFAVLMAQSGAKAIDVARREHPDLVLLDIMMPGLDGLQTCARLKEDEATADIPVIFLSALVDSETKSRGFEVGGVDYVSKPFDSRELVARVRTHLTIRIQERQIRLYADSLESMINERTQRLSRAEDELQRDNDVQRVLNSLLRVSLEGATLRELLRASLEQVLALRWMPFEHCGAVYLRAEGDGEGGGEGGKDGLTLEAYVGGADEHIQPAPFIPKDQCPVEMQRVMTCTVCTVDAPAVQDVPAGTRAVWAPIVHGEALYGVLMARLKPGRSPDAREESFLAAVANTLGRLVLFKRTEEQLFYHAYYDTLTGLPNRTLFRDRVAVEVETAHAAAQGGPAATGGYAVLLMDLDRFTIINESLGHEIGDQLICSVAERLTSMLEQGTTVGRLGGDEFAVLLSGMASSQEPQALAKRMLAAMRRPFRLQGQDYYVTASIGIAPGRVEYARADQVLRDADAALHRAKARGRSRFEVFDHAMRVRAVDTLRLASDMRRGLERREFLLHYQPIVALDTGRVRAFEALVRWQHPERGLVPPDAFIPLAEETGYILPLGEWVLREACEQMVALAPGENGPLLSVNLSGKQFAQDRLYERVAEIVSATGLPPQRLKLEITESAVMEDVEQAVEQLNRLKSLKLRLAIDDFGTGYSSLAYLQRFPVDLLKIDRAFVGRMDSSEDNREIVRTVISLAHTLGMEVIAEGVETAAHMAALRELGCEYGQGYYFSRPVPMEEVRELVLLDKVW